MGIKHVNIKNAIENALRIADSNGGRTETKWEVCDTAVQDKLDDVVNSISDQGCTTLVAAENISATKVVYINGSNQAALADQTTKPEACAIGVAKNTVTAGGDSIIATGGVISDSTFSYTSGQILYLDTNGNITTTAPVTGYQTVIGKALGNNKILINIEQPILL